jgi:DNA-binding PadR family transcriptional regulator
MESSIHDHLPLTEATFFILLSLAPGACHGYAILKSVEDLSSGRVLLSTGTLYGAIKRLLEDGWIERVEGAIPDDTARPRKDYRLTDLGRRILNADVERLEGLVATARLQTRGGTASRRGTM